MARVKDKTTDNIKKFSVWVAGQIRYNNMTYQDVACFLNIDKSGLSNRIHGKTDWKVREMFELFDLFNDEYEYKG